MRTSLMDDRRFRALTLTLRGVYATLLDEADAAGIYAAAPGASLWQAMCLALGCAEGEARELLGALEAGGAVTVGNGAVTLHVGTGGGAQGGKSKALLMREVRARRNTAKSQGESAEDVTATGNGGSNTEGNATGNKVGNETVTRTNETPVIKAVDAGNALVTVAVTQPVTDHGEKGATPAPSPSLPFSPLTLPSLTLPPSPPPTGCENARAVDTAKTGEALVLTPVDAEPRASTNPAKTQAKRAKAAPRPDTIPADGTLAFKVYRAIVTDRELGPITGNPGDFATRISDPDLYPGVDVLATVKSAALYLEGKSGRYSDGRAFLRNSLTRRAEEIAKAPKPAPRSTVVSGATPSAPNTPTPKVTKNLVIGTIANPWSPPRE